MTKFESRLNRFPPFLLYALCRVRISRRERKQILNRQKTRLKNPNRKNARLYSYRRITRKEFSKLSRIPERTLERIVIRVSWGQGDTKVEQMLRFFSACKFDPMMIENVTTKLRKIARSDAKFAHLSVYQMRQFEVRCQQWARHLEKKGQ